MEFLETSVHSLAHLVSLLLQAIAILVIAYGALEAVIAIAGQIVRGRSSTGRQRREVFLTLARWLTAGLTFQLAADIVETTVVPTWQQLGQLASIAVIRTFLTYFLDRDMDTVRRRELSGNEGIE